MLEKIVYSDIKFKQIKNRFEHNLPADFACFALWKDARPYREKARALLASKFDILLETEIQWSKEYFHSNVARLYEAPMFTSKENFNFYNINKIGDNRFILFVVRDKTPNYTYAQSVSGKIELSNLNVVDAKYQMRDWIYADTKVEFAVHSTNNIQEFFFQAPLLLGIKLFRKILNGEKQEIDCIEKDLEGAAGWRNWEELFDILNITNNYLVLRGFEQLPNSNPEKDLDILTDNYQLFASTLGAQQTIIRPYKGMVIVGNETISLDIRFVGDNYYDTSWSKDMLETKILRNRVFVPNDDHYFFSLLFHAKVQKPKVKPIYIDILKELATKLNFGSWYQTEILKNDDKIGRILNGYFRANHYFYLKPIDHGVHENKKVSKHLPLAGNLSPKSVLILTKIKWEVRKYLPDSLVNIINKVLGRA